MENGTSSMLANDALQQQNGVETDSESEADELERMCEPADPNQIQLESTNQCVKIDNLKKHFMQDGNVVRAVDGLSLTMYPGEIFALLGHNGAGKTTAISVLTGLIPSSGGSISVYEHDLENEMDALRGSLGVCPQHNVLWDDLTVYEHVRLFASFRNMPSDRIEAHVHELIAAVGLTDKTHTLSKALSGGMKRRLSVAIAFVGDPKLIVLDEPTSGMDPYSRRALWDLLKRLKENRIIILTTHYMEEADVLGDRIAIMSGGKLKCCGSSLFLKNLYGCGYNLTMVRTVNEKGKQGQTGPGTLVPNSEVLAFIKQFVPETEVMSEVGAEFAVRLPFSASVKFEQLFNALDEKKRQFSIGSYGVSVTTLEEVFLKVASGQMAAVNERHFERHASTTTAPAVAGASASAGGGSSSGTAEATRQSVHGVNVSVGGGVGHDTHASEETVKFVEGPVLYLKQFEALLKKRVWYAQRDMRAVMCQCVLPVIMLLFGLMVLKYSHRPTTQPSIVMDTSHYNTLLSRQNLPSHVMPFTADFDVKDNATMLLKSAADAHLIDSATWLPVDDRLTCEDKDKQIVRNKAGGMNPFANINIPGLSPSPNVSEKFFNFSVNLLATTGQQQASRYGGMAFMYEQSESLRKIMETMGVDVEEAMKILEEWKNQKRDEQAEAMAGGDGNKDLIANVLDLFRASTALFVNTTSLHAPAVFANLRSNMLLNVFGAQRHAKISTMNHPLPPTYWEKNDINSAAIGWGIAGSLFVIISFSFIPAGIVAYVVREKQTQVKFQQFVSGVSYWTYWSSNFVFDSAFFALPVLCAMGFFYYFRIITLINHGGAQWTAMLLLLYGPACTAQTYLTSFLFSNYTTAQNVTLACNLMLGTVLTLFVFMIEQIAINSKSAKMSDFAFNASAIFRILPTFCLGHGLLRISDCSPDGKLAIQKLIDGKNQCEDYLKWDILGGDFTYLIVESFVYLLLVVVIDAGSSLPTVKRLAARLFPTPPLPPNALCFEDDDVRAEKERVKGIQPDPSHWDDHVIRVEGVRKVFGGGCSGGAAKHAVKNVSFAASAGEVIGVLGVNGAGKTTTLRMLCGDAYPDDGSIHITGRDLGTELGRCRRMIGYCPQFDALLDLLTCREHLTLFAQIKGIPDHQIEKCVNDKLHEMNLVQYTDKRAGTLSGGNKRKLSVAVAIIGEPPIVFMDEPSCGMDPVARRFMWTVIQNIAQRRKKSAILVTTHSMEEAEALATRLLIMVEGQAKCIGAVQHIKQVYGQGFELTLKTKQIEETAIKQQLETWQMPADAPLSKDHVAHMCSQNADRLLAALGATDSSINSQIERVGFIPGKLFAEWWLMEDAGQQLQQVLRREFPGAQVLEHHGYMWRFHLPKQQDQEVALGDLFGRLEACREEACVSEYSLSQTTLEQIFNQFAALASNPHAE
eukprot:GDKI01048985.1.p1 GENE.GDKI01048985.1~~GDKI01048985.1.p1  ORF type:complete len:1423 (-),score=406.43 GDKI01048985.1:254-4522(-)